MKLFTFSLLVFFSAWVTAQCVVPYNDVMGQLYAYDNGETHFVEPSQPTSFKVGKNYFAYINQNNSRLRLYYAGKTYTVCENAADYWATDNWFVYKNFGSLGVLYGNQLKAIDNMVLSNYWIGDSILAWLTINNEVKVFYDGQARIIDYFSIGARTNRAGETVANARMGINTFAYVDQSGVFKVFAGGEIKQLETYTPSFFIAGKDMVAYIDYSNNWKFYDKGETYETHTYGVTRFWMGEGFFAYNTISKQLAVWYNGEEKILAQDVAKNVTVQRNMIAFTDKSNNFYVWSNGNLELLERYQPLSVKVYRNLVVYQDQDGRLKGYYYGKQINISDQIVSSYELYNETVIYSLIRGETTIWCNNKSQTISQ
jgi:hypothetical protein